VAISELNDVRATPSVREPREDGTPPAHFPGEANFLKAMQSSNLVTGASDSQALELLSRSLFESNDAVSVFRKIALSTPETLATAQKVLEAYGDKLKVPGMSDKTLIKRLADLPFFAAPSAERRLFVQAVVEALQDRSARLATAIDRAPKEAVWDVIAIGAGPHNSGALYDLKEANPGLRTLAIDKDESSSGNFLDAGEGFYLNSSNRAEDGKNAAPGRGNLNQVGGPVGVPDASGKKYPLAQAVGETSVVALYESDSDVLLKTEVVEVLDRERSSNGLSWPARYQVTVKTPDDGGREVRRVVYANRLAVGTGLADVSLPFDESSRELARNEIERSEKEVEAGRMPTGLMTSAQLFRAAKKVDNPREVFRDYSLDGKDAKVVTSIIGAGDGAKISLELIYGTGPDEQYDNKLDRASLGQTGPTIWFTGKKGPGTREDLINGSRPRYADLVGLVRGRERDVLPQQGRVKRIEKRPAGRGEGEVYEITLEKDGRAEIFAVDRVVLATGVTTNAGPLLKAVLPANYDPKKSLDTTEYVEPVLGTYVGSPDKEVPLAQRVKGQDIYLVGPAAGPNLVTEDETVGITQNRASLFALNPRSRAAAVKYLSVPPDQRVKSSLDATGPDAQFLLSPGATSAKIQLDVDDELPTLPRGLDNLQLSHELGRFFDRLRLPGLVWSDGPEVLKLSMVRTGNSLRIETNLGQDSWGGLSRLINSNSELKRLLVLFTPENTELTVTAQTRQESPSMKRVALSSIESSTRSTVNWF